MMHYSDESDDNDDAPSCKRNETDITMADINSGMYIASAPAELLNAPPGNDLNEVTIERRLDGILALGTKLDFIAIKKPLKFTRELVICSRSFRQFKGITELSMFPDILEISLGYTNSFELSLLLCSTTDRCSKYNEILSQVYNVLHEACLQCPEDFKVKRLFVETGRDILEVHPTNWSIFSELVFEKLTDAFMNSDTFNIEMKNPMILEGQDGVNGFKCYFSVRRMGQDLKLEDEMPYLSWDNIAKIYSELNHRSPALLSIAVHIAIDILFEEECFPMWDISGIKKILERPRKVFNPFFIPGIGNIIYDFTFLENITPIKFIQFYTRLGHQVHRNDNRCFKEVFAVSNIAGALGLLLVKKKAIVECERYERCLSRLLKSYKVVDHIIQQIKLPTAARCEVVTEHRCLFSMDGEMKQKNSTISSILNQAYCSTNVYTNLKGLIHPKYLIKLPIDALTKWLEQTLIPCRNVLQNSTTTALEMIQRKLAIEKEKDGAEKNRKSKVIACDTYPVLQVTPISFSSNQFLNILVAEAIITMFIRGELSTKWPIYISRTLGLSSVQWKKRGEECPISLIKFEHDKIECDNLGCINISSHLPKWIGLSDRDTYASLLTNFKNLKKLKKSGERQAYDLVTGLCLDILLLIYSEVQGTSNNIKFKHLNTITNRNYGICNKTVISPEEYVTGIEHAKFGPQVVSCLFSAINETVKSRFDGLDFKIHLISYIRNEILNQSIPFYARLDKTTVAAILPIRRYEEKMVSLYNEAFEWIIERNTGIRGIPAATLINRSLEKFMDQDEVESISILAYINAINFCLDQVSEIALKNHLYPWVFSQNLIKSITQ